jgi:hypothetical protein
MNAYQAKVWAASGGTLYLKAPKEIGKGSTVEVWKIPGTGCWGIRVKEATGE